MRIYIATILIAFCFAGIPNNCDAQIFGRYSNFKKRPDYFKSAKAGFGLPYGIFGACGEIGIKYFSILGGAGVSLIGRAGPAFGWSVGARAYFMPDKERRIPKKIRVRIGAHYGVNGVYKEDGVRHVATGVSLSGGIQQRFKDNFFYDMDINILMNSTNSFRPTNRELEYPAFPSIGIGVIL